MELPALGGLLASTILTAASGPTVRTWLEGKQNFDHPNERSSHAVSTPRGGGLACAAGGVAGATVSHLLGSGATADWVGASSVLGVVGRLDDIGGLPPSPRLAVQVLTGMAAGARAGGLLGAAFGSAAVPAIVNAFNFMDGINGISGGTATAWGVVVATDSTMDPASQVQGALGAGMGLGFLPYNVPSASMFLGDIGSYLLGSGIAVTVVQSAFRGGRPDPKRAGRALMPLAPYLADTGSTIVRRAIKGESVTEAHREHTYQRLVQKTDWPHWAVSGLVAGATAACGLAGRKRYGGVAVALIVALYLSSPAVARIVGPHVSGLDRTKFGGNL